MESFVLGIVHGKGVIVEQGRECMHSDKAFKRLIRVPVKPSKLVFKFTQVGTS